jgi:alkanesulfonate monooxygenase SsuD/methylene tetrahydromethanopterin reductase-like flavin-dependent oxidoreductase (luciferase family)
VTIELDTPVDKHAGPVLGGHDALKLALFAINLRGGATLADVEGNVRGSWSEIERYARHADRIGLDAIVPIARWRGYGGDADLGDRSFETFTWATGLLAATRRLQVFATVHVPLVHPVFAAKMAATADHISGGRFGLNIVAGWYAKELEMFGVTQREHDDRYAVADEWTSILKQLWTRPGTFDVHGRFYDIPAAFSEPKPLQRPYPTIMNAGTSPAGRDFAAKHSDVSFAGLTALETAAEQIAAIKQHARDRHGREIKVFGRAHVVCRDTEREARDYYDLVHRRRADLAGAANVTGISKAESQSTDWTMDQKRLLEGMIAGLWAVPIVGSPEQVAERMLHLRSVGADGLAISFVDYDDGLARLEEQVLPLLVQAGVRREGARA